MSSPSICYTSTFSTLAGKFSVAIDDSGAVVATAFGGLGALRKRTHGGRMRAAGKKAAALAKEISHYFSGQRSGFAAALSPAGTPFQMRVWAELMKIPYGETRSYGELARTLGSSPRAVGRAVGANPICLLVPCHRVIGSNGSLTGFAFGFRIKLKLLRHEGAAPFAA
jgi:methylated-DNA-[protein]-cysteine S-methyltransferase